MPEFQMPLGDDAEALATWSAFDDFTRGYVEAMFFTSTGLAEDEDIEDATFSDLHPDAIEAIKRDCMAFQDRNIGCLKLARLQPGYDDAAAGRDYWYTRNGHGVGYWDHAPLQAVRLGRGDYTSLAEVLAQRAHAEGMRDLYRGDDGSLHLA